MALSVGLCNCVHCSPLFEFRLEYKYQQLKQSAKEGDELPAPETCVQESGDEDEVVYEQGIKPGHILLKKLKGMAGKRKVSN